MTSSDAELPISAVETANSEVEIALAQIINRLEQIDFDNTMNFTLEPCTSEFFPPNIIKRLSFAQKLQLATSISNAMPFVDGHFYKKSTSSDEYVRMICSGSGKPSNPRSYVEREVESSKRLDCNRAWFKVGPEQVQFQLLHLPDCVSLTEAQILEIKQRKDNRVPKEIEESAINDIVPSLASERVKDFDIKDRTRKFLADRGYAIGATDSYLTRLLRLAKEREKKSVNPVESVNMMLSSLREKGISHSVKTKLVNGVLSTNAIHMRIPELTGREHKTHFYVYTADVTHGVVDGRTGFTKLSMISGISPGHQVFPQVESLIVSESLETFVSELSFLMNEDVSLVSRPVIFLVDGDDGRISAIKSLLPMARVYLCLWHKEQNVISKATPVLTAMHAPKPSKQQLLDQLHALGFKGNRNETNAVLEVRLAEAVKASATVSTLQNSAGGAAASNDDGSMPAQELSQTAEEDAEEDDAASVASNAPNDSADVIPEMASITRISARQIFKWLQRARDEAECDQRLGEMAVKYPKLADYVNRELRSNKHLWAEFARVWGLTFNLNTSTMQENAHWTIKSQLRGKSVLAHRFVNFVIEAFSRRQTRIIGRLSTPQSIGRLTQSALEVNKAFAEVVQRTISIEGQHKIFEEFGQAHAYSYTELDSVQEVHAAVPFDRRGASARRFALLIPNDGPLVGQFFKVTHLDRGTHDLVHIFEDGSIACTCGRFASSGFPDRHFFVLLRSKEVAFNPVAHIHPAYFENPIVFSDDLTVPHDLKKTISTSATWQTAVEVTKERWTREGLGGMGRIIPISPNRLENTRPTSMLQRASKAAFQIRDMAAINETILDRLERFVEEQATWLQGVTSRSISVAGNEVQLPPATRKTGSKRSRMASDYIKKNARKKSS